jgi:hypothetical protein
MAHDSSANIVLAHGFPGFPKIGKLEYFKGVEKHLKRRFKSRGIKIRIPRLGAVAETAARATKLRKDIKRKFDGPVHIIAHSGGGLDARYLASPGGLGRDDLVASITTISTPHRGALIADLLTGSASDFSDDAVRRLVSKLRIAGATRPVSRRDRRRHGGANQADSVLRRLGVRAGDPSRKLIETIRSTVRDAARLVEELTDLSPDAIRGFSTEYMKQFNIDVPNADGVKYCSYAGVSGVGEEDVLAPIFYPMHLLLLLEDQRNDGWITVESAKWGEFKGEIAADHADQIGHDLSIRSRIRRMFGRPAFNHLAFYEQIVEDLLGD